jgi:hypothetical protein
MPRALRLQVVLFDACLERFDEIEKEGERQPAQKKQTAKRTSKSFSKRGRERPKPVAPLLGRRATDARSTAWQTACWRYRTIRRNISRSAPSIAFNF